MNKLKILFIVHDASRTGAPVVLLSFLNWLKNNGSADFDVLLLQDGPLRKDFESLAQTFFIPAVYKYNFQNKINRRLHPELAEDYKISEVCNNLNKKNYTLIYGNTIVSLPWLLKFKKSADVKVVCAIHELSNVIEYFFEREYIITELPKIDLVLAGSQAVEKNLVEDFKIPADKIKVVHAFINTRFNIIKNSEKLREELGIKKNELVIGGMGLAELRKGIDLIIPLALKLKNNFPDVMFKIIWVGGTSADKNIGIFKRDLKKCGLENEIIFIENTSLPDDYINLYDVFVLFSREDPFPLVLLSAALMEKPIIAFANSGGAEELLNDGAGFLAPYLNVETVAKNISEIYHDPSIGKQAALKAKQKVKNEFSADVIPDKLYNILNSVYLDNAPV